MKSEFIVPYVIIAIVYGIILGMVTILLSKKLALSRTDDPGKLAPLNKAPLKITAIALGIGASFGIIFTGYAEIPLMIRNLLLLVPIFSISFVDALVRKIPNPLLLTMIFIDLVYIVYACIANPSEIGNTLKDAFIGLFVGMLVCLIPSLLKIPMGAGDIKYSAVIGLCIGCWGYFQSMILMSVFVAIFWIYLKVAKKGTIRTQIPMGPFLSLGTVVTMCFPIYKEFISPELLSLI